jgi:hypothetical protein
MCTSKTGLSHDDDDDDDDEDEKESETLGVDVKNVDEGVAERINIKTMQETVSLE